MKEVLLDKCWDEDASGVFLIGARCSRCSKTFFPPRETCTDCGAGSTLYMTPLSRSGRLYSFSRVHQSKPGFPTPYAIGYVDLPEGVRIPGRIVEPPGCDLVPGCTLEVTKAEIAQSREGRPLLCYAFRPI